MLRATKLSRRFCSAVNLQWIKKNVHRPLLPPSVEQVKILSKISQGHNVVVDAIAGSGKTSTILQIGNHCVDVKTLVLTYNAKLKEETRERLVLCDLDKKVEVHSYHSFGYKYYNSDCKTDIGIQRVIKEHQEPLRKVPNFGIIVLDEAQDITRELFHFFLKIYSDIPPMIRPPQIILFGDRKQSIYQFKGSDDRYLTFTEMLFLNTGLRPEWSRLSLSTSFRVSGNMAAFVNRAMVKEQLIHATKQAGQPVQYLVGGAFRAVEWIVNKILQLRASGIAYDDMIVLAPSVKSISKSKNPLTSLVNELVERDILVHITNDVEAKATAEVSVGKLLFTTFHQSKGIERKVVIVFNFDKSYFDYYARDSQRHHCSNQLYVACTRAKELLILVAEEYKDEHLPFLDRKALSSMGRDVVEVVELSEKCLETNKKPFYPSSGPIDVSVPVSALTGWIPEAAAHWCMSQLTRKKLSGEVHSIDLPGTVQFKVKKAVYSEQVSDLNGMAIPAMLEGESNQVSMLDYLENAVSGVDKTGSDKVSKTLLKHYTAFKKRVVALSTTDHYLELACMYDAAVTGYTHKLKQIKHYDWLDEDEVARGVNFLRELVVTPRTAEFEMSLSGTSEKYKDMVSVMGFVDIATQSTLFEVKCVKELTSVHFIQLALYAWLWGKTHPDEPRSFQLVNVTTGEVWDVSADQGTLEAIANKVIHHYLNRPFDERSDDVFVSETNADIVRYTTGSFPEAVTSEQEVAAIADVSAKKTRAKKVKTAPVKEEVQQ